MYYILQDFSEKNAKKTRRLTLGGKEVVVTQNAMLGKNSVYILPKENGTHAIAGVEFFRNNRGILVAHSEIY